MRYWLAKQVRIVVKSRNTGCVLDGRCKLCDFRLSVDKAKLTHVDRHNIIVLHQHEDHLNISFCAHYCTKSIA